jgi:hypothetical protein
MTRLQVWGRARERYEGVFYACVEARERYEHETEEENKAELFTKFRTKLVAFNQAETALLTYHAKCFNPTPPTIFDFCEKDYDGWKYNKKYIIQVSNGWLNIQRKVAKKGIFSMPMQVWAAQLNTTIGNYYLVSVEGLQEGIFYDVGNNPHWVLFIEDCFKSNRETYSTNMEQFNRLLNNIE